MAKRYKLKKDLPTFKAGDVFEISLAGNLVTRGECISDCVVAYAAQTLEKFPNILADWFEEIPEEPKTVWDLKEGDECWIRASAEGAVISIRKTYLGGGGGVKMSNLDKDINAPLKFQPMPKRFMVFLQFASQPNNWYEVKTCYGHEICIGLDGRLSVIGAGRDTAAEEFLINDSEIIICQSTNLFDKDGEEIFEGSIVRRAWECARDDEDAPLFLVVWSPDRAEFVFRYGIFHNGVEQIIDKKAFRDVKVIGHILSNPELLEEK